MRIDKDDHFLEEIDRMINAGGVSYVLSAVEEACNRKADNVRQNYHDEVLARKWERLAKIIAHAESEIGR